MFSKKLTRGLIDKRPVFIDSVIVDRSKVVILAMVAGNDAQLRAVGERLGKTRSVRLSGSSLDVFKISATEFYGFRIVSCNSPVYPHASTMLIWQRRKFERDFPGRTDAWSLLPAAASTDNAMWENVKSLSPVPLLDAWRGRVMEELRGPGRRHTGMVLGDSADLRQFIWKPSAAWQAVRVCWAGKRGPQMFAEKISELLRSGALPLPADNDPSFLRAAAVQGKPPVDFAKVQKYAGVSHAPPPDFGLADI